MKEAFTVGNTRLVDGKWQDFNGMVVGEEAGGLLVTAYQKLFEIDEDRMLNPANGDVLYRTKKDKQKGQYRHYFSPQTGICVSVYYRGEHGQD